MRSGSIPRASARSTVEPLEADDVDDGIRGRHQRDVAADLSERADGVRSALCSASLPFEHEGAHRRVDRGEMAVEDLLGVMCLGRHARALAELEYRLENGRDVAPGAGDDHPLVVGDRERLRGELALDLLGEAADVLALQRSSCCDRARVAHRMAVALLDLRRRDDHVVDCLRERGVGRARDQPRLTRERLDGLEREASPAFMADRNEDIGLRRIPEHELEGLDARPTRESSVVRGTAAREENAGALGKTTLADPFGHTSEPLGLGGDGRSGQVSGHARCLYHRARWRSSRRRSWATVFAS